MQSRGSSATPPAGRRPVWVACKPVRLGTHSRYARDHYAKGLHVVVAHDDLEEASWTDEDSAV
jgi:hypothetical protein